MWDSLGGWGGEPFNSLRRGLSFTVSVTARDFLSGKSSREAFLLFQDSIAAFPITATNWTKTKYRNEKPAIKWG